MSNIQEVIEQIKSQVELRDLFMERGIDVLSNGQGKYKTKCPFHEEKTPSMVIFEDTQHYHCFGCGENGDAITFYSKMNVLSFIETLEYLGERIGITLDLEADPKFSNLKKKNALLSYVDSMFKNYFKNLPIEHPAKQNVLERGLPLDDWYGWAPKDSQEILDKLKSKGYTIEEMRDAGLLNKKDKLFFFNRLMFTIHGKTNCVFRSSNRTGWIRKIHQQPNIRDLQQSRNIV